MPQSDVTKPPYHVPSMAEIAALPWNGFNAISTFSGCGGSSLGYKLAGFKVLWASEFIPAAQDTYRANHPDTILDTRDIRQVQAQEILDAIGMKAGELDLMDGSPPCASFSTAGKREAGWGKVKAYSDTKQRTDDLFFEYTRLLKGIQPKVFVAENVSGLVKGTAKGYFLEILKAFKDCGYTVQAKLLDAQWLGVPQMRQRIIFVGVRNDLGLAPAFPKPLSYQYSVRDAIPWITTIGTSRGFSLLDQIPSDHPYHTIGTAPQQGNSLARFVEAYVQTFKGERSIDDPAPSVLTHGRQHTTNELMIRQGNKNGHSSQRGQIVDLTAPAPTIIAGGGSGQFDVIEPESDISTYAIEREWDNTQQGKSNEQFFSLKRAGLENPSFSVTAEGGHTSTASVTHPTEKRKFSIAELKRICAFPDDFILTETYTQQWERLGRAVPPVMMEKIAIVIRDEILCKIP